MKSLLTAIEYPQTGMMLEKNHVARLGYCLDYSPDNPSLDNTWKIIEIRPTYLVIKRLNNYNYIGWETIGVSRAKFLGFELVTEEEKILARAYTK